MAISRSPSTSGALAMPQVADARVVVLDVALVPEHLARLDVETVQHPRRAERVDPVAVDGGRRARADGVGPLQHPVRRVPLVGPQHLARLLVEGHQALGPVERARLRILLPVEDEHPAVRHRGPREAGPDRRTPRHLQTVIRQAVDDPVFVPDRQPARAAPLGPVVGGQGLRAPHDARQHEHDERETVPAASKSHPVTPFLSDGPWHSIPFRERRGGFRRGADRGRAAARHLAS